MDEKKNVGTAISVILQEAKTSKVFEIKNGNPVSVCFQSPASFLTIFVLIATQTEGDEIKLKCPDVGRFHMDLKLRQNYEEYGLTINSDSVDPDVLHLKKTSKWEDITNDWIMFANPIV